MLRRNAAVAAPDADMCMAVAPIQGVLGPVAVRNAPGLVKQILFYIHFL
ncbi:hypothetical protein SAMN04488581_3502 [Mycolicibacterium neoaurum]|nr:hypothetical protein SAMN04488581_3502 [Mycolicibacterium neoaurum]